MVASVLQRPTLVLNRNWQPVHVATVQRALVLLFNGAARVVDPESYQMFDWDDWQSVAPDDDEPHVRSVRFRLRVPDVVVLVDFDRMPRTSVSFSKRNILKRDHYTCQYCGCQPGKDALTIDHVVPRSQGGATSWENCVAACSDCNRKKADRTPHQAGLQLKKAPKRPDWRPIYFALSPRQRANWSAFLEGFEDEVGAA